MINLHFVDLKNKIKGSKGDQFMSLEHVFLTALVLQWVVLLADSFKIPGGFCTSSWVSTNLPKNMSVGRLTMLTLGEKCVNMCVHGDLRWTSIPSYALCSQNPPQPQPRTK